MSRLFVPLAPVALFAAAASAIPPTIPEPEQEYPLAFDEWKGSCSSRSGCYAKRPWWDNEIFISIEPAVTLPGMAHRPAYVRYSVRSSCSPSSLANAASLALPLAELTDVAAHLSTAIENETGPCAPPPLDEAAKASVTRLVRMFTLAGGIAYVPYPDGPPGDTDYNRRPLNPDIWIDEIADFPESAKERRQGGKVAAQLTIRNDLGKPVLCHINESSGVVALDEATCKLLMKNARFERGTGMSHYTHRVTWDIAAIPVPFCVLCEIGPDGIRRPQERDMQGRPIRRPGHTDEKPQ